MITITGIIGVPHGLYLFIRTTFVYITLIAGAWCALATELLSVFHLIIFTGVALCWLLPAAVGVRYALIHRKTLLSLFTSLTISWMAAVITLILLISLFIAIAYPPNNYDSMTYHMARVAHWIQNKSIAFYPTHVGRQLIFQPFAEWIILHIQLLTGSDRLANAVQLFFFAGCILVISLITKELGGTRRQQLLSGLFSCLIPMAIAQSNTTQNDVVAAYFVLCFVYFTLLLQKSTIFSTLIFAGISLGLAWLTKGTTYIFTLPFIGWYIIPFIKNARQAFPNLPRLALIPLIALLINLGFFYRNLSATGSLLGTAGNDLANEGAAPISLTLVGVKDLLNHFPVTYDLKQRLMHASALLGVDADNPKYSYTPTRRMAEGFHFDEDYGQNLVHTVLIIVLSIHFLSGRSLYTHRLNYYKLFVLTLFATSALFCLLLKWQPWSNRLETTLFMLYCIFLAFEWDVLKKWMQTIMMMPMLIFGAASLLWSTHHPLLPIKDSIFKKPYSAFIYSDALLSCQRYLDDKPYTKLGIFIGGDSWDYPYYKLLSHSGGKTRTLEHVMVANPSAAFGEPFIPDAIISIEGTKEKYIFKGRDYFRTATFSSGLAVFEKM